MKLKNLSLIVLCAGTFTFTSCSTDDEIPVPDINRTGSLTIEDQTLRDERLILTNINVSQQSYLVLRKGGADGEIIATPRLIRKGETTNISIRLNSGVELNDGDTVTAILHNDTNQLGRFEFDGESGIDDPITSDSGEVVMETFTVSVMADPTGSLTVEDQALVNNMLTVESITLDRSGYVVVHADTAETGANFPVVPEIISEPVYLEAGTHSNVQIMIEESAEVMADDVLWVMLHTDTGNVEVYEFDGQNGFDKPILDEEGMIVMEAVMITDIMNDATGSLAVNDQILSNNNINVGSITVGQDSYVVVHASNETGGPVVPEIISQPVYLEEGSYENVIIPLLESADVNEGDTVWVMLHEDTGTEEEYEFDGQNGLDLPIVIDGEIVMESLMITEVENSAISGKLVVQDQALSESNTIIVETINLIEDGWVVVHAAAETGGPVVPEIISMPVYLEAGKHDNVEVSLLESANVEAGDTVYVMLHNDTGLDAVYEFDGMNGLDLPIVVDGAILVKPVVITED